MRRFRGAHAIPLAVLVLAGGCVSSEKSQYSRHLDARIMPTWTADGVTTVASLARTGETAALGVLSDEPREPPAGEQLVPAIDASRLLP